MRLKVSLSLAILALAAVSAWADDTASPDCANPMTQADMNICAGMSAAEADKALNVQYRKTRAAAAAFDQQMGPDAAVSAVATLTAAQKAWIPYRDATCEIQRALSGGGSIEPTLVAGCLETETEKRTGELKELETQFSQ